MEKEEGQRKLGIFFCIVDIKEENLSELQQRTAQKIRENRKTSCT